MCDCSMEIQMRKFSDIYNLLRTLENGRFTEYKITT